VGIGLHSETYLVVDDYTMRSMSRFLMVDKAHYLDALKDTSLSAEAIALN
tara:strand:- start:250 stop:399 length:150 start_codon:yes stop_codon:yes gene_type:complete